MNTQPYLDDVQTTYDRVAAEYAGRFGDELIHKPLDRDILSRFADLVRGQGEVCDIGCGPGQVTRYLRVRSIPTIGIDLSPTMVSMAQRLNPHIHFETGNILALDTATEAWAGIVAFYVISHLERADVPQALSEMFRTLQPGGWLLLAIYVGEGKVHLDEWWGRSVSIDFVLFEDDEMQTYLEQAGFEIVDTIKRNSYPDVEFQGPRAYFLAQKPERV